MLFGISYNSETDTYETYEYDNLVTLVHTAHLFTCAPVTLSAGETGEQREPGNGAQSIKQADIMNTALIRSSLV